jgi:hypothetical protein
MEIRNVDVTKVSAGLRSLADRVDESGDYGARDWKGFFEAIAAFMASVLPLIMPFFSENEKKKLSDIVGR